jgi:hypothetical protein
VKRDRKSTPAVVLYIIEGAIGSLRGTVIASKVFQGGTQCSVEIVAKSW